MNSLTRKSLIVKKNTEIRRLELEVANLTSECPHNILSRERNIKTLVKKHRIWRVWHDTEFEPVNLKIDKRPNTWEKNQPIYAELQVVYDREPERIWSFGGAYCSICSEDFGWYCPDSPTKYCEYKKTNMDRCDYCGLPEERK